MKWKLKWLLQAAFSRLPCGGALNYFFQRRIVHSLPMSDAQFREKRSAALTHLGYYHRYRSEGDFCYEVGCGRELSMAMKMSLHGFREIHCADVLPLRREDLVNHARRQYERLWHEYPDMAKIHYAAPLYFTQTPYPSDFFDLIYSHTVLEHVPRKDLLPLLAECRRILRPRGIVSCFIGYADHWHYFDGSITPYNFLQYSEKEWGKYSPSFQYQNRLRHSDYLKIFEEAGFEIVEANPRSESDAVFDTVRLHPEFAGYEREDLKIIEAWIVGRKIQEI
jgi:SAM-dependent methyltransferase